MLALTRAMAASYGRDRVRVNAICPGTIRTRLTADIIERVEREAAEGRQIPLGRVGEPEDIARCALFLASDSSSWISGTEIRGRRRRDGRRDLSALSRRRRRPTGAGARR